MLIYLKNCYKYKQLLKDLIIEQLAKFDYMKRALYIMMILFVLTKMATAQYLAATTARKHFGQNQMVEGVVRNFELMNGAKTTVLYFARDFPYQDLAVIISDNRSGISHHPEFRIKQQRIWVKGNIFLWRGQPAIKVKKWEDVNWVDTLARGLFTSDHNSFADSYQPLSYFKGDTSCYIFNNFIFGKDAYQGKPLAKLLDKLEIPVIRYVPIISELNVEAGQGKNQNTGTYLYFYGNTRFKTHHRQEPAILYIRFKNPVSMDSSLNLIRRYYNKHNDSLAFYYRQLLIDSIDYVHYHFAKAPKDTSVWPHYPVKKEGQGKLIVN